MSLRIPNAPMEGLSIDVKKFASDASTFFNRARQFTEEQLGQAEKTKLDEDVDSLWNRFEATHETINKLKQSVEGENNWIKTPNPNLRYEKMLLSKIDSTNTLGRPTDESQYQGLGRTLEATSTSQKPHNEKFAEVLGAIGQSQLEIAKCETTFVNDTKEAVLRPFHSFLENDCKTIFKEKKALETCRLDLDAAKAKLKKVKTLEMRDQVENEVQAAQADFMRQQELLKLLLENISSAQTTQLRAMVEFVNNQTAYLTAAASSAKALQAQIQDLALELGSSNSTQFPRKNSNSNNVPVNDILKDEK